MATLKVKTSSLLLSFVMGCCLLFFQNCGNVSIGQNAAAQTAAVLAVSNTIVQTTLNQPLTITLETGMTAPQISFSQTSVVTEETLTNAKVSIDQNNQIVTFTPNLGFRGTVPLIIYATSNNVTDVQNINVQVINPVLDFTPALAVRGTNCLSCHSNVQGDLVTDFGFKSAGDPGPDLFFATGTPNYISIYGSAYASGGQSLNTASLIGHLLAPDVTFANIDPSISRQFYPASPTASTPDLVSWLTQEKQLPTNTGFLGLTAKNSVYIGAPLASEIITNGSLTATQKQNFFPNSSTAGNVTGFNHVQTGNFNYYTNSTTAPMVCEGDLFVDGVVWLNSLNLQTTYGCRIYATHSVFINGPITYVNVYALSNLQISSASGVYMGFGYCVDCAGSGVATTANSNDANNYAYSGKNTLAGRWGILAGEGVPNFRNSTFTETVATSLADFALVSNNLPSLPAAPPSGTTSQAYYLPLMSAGGVNLLDASNSFVSQGNLTYSHLLLNAPVVMSRYSGDFQGLVIGEFTMWRLGAFTFNFDPVFTGVPLLPFLDFTKILNVQ